MMEMNFEELNFRNMVWFYQDELSKIDEGENAKNVFSTHFLSKLSKKKILELTTPNIGGRKLILTDKAKETLESMR